MMGLSIGAAELAEIEAGAPSVVLAPGILLPHAPPLVPLCLKDGVLARPGAAAGRMLPLPAGFRPLALIAPEDAAPALAALLPPGLAVHHTPHALPALLAAALAESGAARLAAEAERDRLRRALGPLTEPRPALALEIAPGPGRAATPLAQPLGRPAEGLCTVELHLAAPGALRVRLLAGEVVLGQWEVPEAATAPGWLALDLPEPAPPGPAEARLELLAAPPLSAGAEPDSPLALRLWTAGPGWSVWPRFLAWAALGATRPTTALPLPPALLAMARCEGGALELVAIGAEAARLLVTLSPGGEALVTLPPLPVGPADLLRARIAPLTGPAPAFELRLASGTAQAATGRRTSGPATIWLPLPQGPMLDVRIALWNPGADPATVEIVELALAAAAAGEPRRPPPPEAAPMRTAPARLPLPDAAWRATAPAPRMAAALPGGAAPPLAPLAPGAAFQDVTLHQHLATADGGYRHLDLGVSGLVSGGGLWRQLRFKLFERRGVVGLEFREAKGWPQMFDIWPGGRSDQFGPFWRLETEGAGDALAALGTPHDRALVAALVELLPEIAARGARLAGLAGSEAEDWPARARRLDAAVGAARGR